MLILFDNAIADIEASKKLSSRVTEFLLRGRKPNISRGNLTLKCGNLTLKCLKLKTKAKRDALFYHENT